MKDSGDVHVALLGFFLNFIFPKIVKKVSGGVGTYGQNCYIVGGFLL